MVMRSEGLKAAWALQKEEGPSPTSPEAKSPTLRGPTKSDPHGPFLQFCKEGPLVPFVLACSP